MSDIRITRRHVLGLERARRAAQKVADDLSAEYGFESRWNGDVLRFSRSGVRGELVVGPEEVHLDAHLGMLLAAFKPRIEAHINDQFDRYFV